MRLARRRFSALQRAEIAEIDIVDVDRTDDWGFSALQRAEIAEMAEGAWIGSVAVVVSVLFNEPKLLKWNTLTIS